MHGSASVDDDSDREQLAYKVSRAARLLDLSERKVWQLVKDGEIEAFKVGWSRRIARDSLLAYIERQKRAA